MCILAYLYGAVLVGNSTCILHKNETVLCALIAITGIKSLYVNLSVGQGHAQVSLCG